MGNLFSSKSNSSLQKTSELEALQARLSVLEAQAIDLNNDGVISKDEFNRWKKQQENDFAVFRKKLIDSKEQEYSEKITDLKRQIKSLRHINKGLSKEIKEQNEKLTNINVDNAVAKPRIVKKAELFSVVSKQRIKEAVDRMLANKTINVGYLPDFVERQIYNNVFNILLGLVNELVEGSHIKLLGHQITLDLEAIENQISKEEELTDK
tara:strand:- start:140 stop:766 length:627 start_codon:yes stop_codon:yes gene_type:complete